MVKKVNYMKLLKVRWDKMTEYRGQNAVKQS